MTSEMLSPADIWDSIEISGDFDTSIIATAVEDGIEYKKLYISGCKFGDSFIRVFLVIARNVEENGQPLIILTGEPDCDVDYSALKFWVEKGYTCIFFDYGGRKDASRYTIYPNTIESANYDIAKKQLFTHKDEIKTNVWYHYLSVAKAVLKYSMTLSDVDTNNIGIVGYGIGGKFAWHMSAYANEIKVAVSLLEGGWRNYYRCLNLNDDELEKRANYLVYFSTGSTISHIKKPMLFLGASNNDYGYMDRIVENINRINPEVDFRHNFSMQTVNLLSNNAKRTMVKFIAKYLKNEQSHLMKRPSLTCKLEGSNVSVKVNIDEAVAVKEVKVYYAFDKSVAMDKFWRSVTCDSANCAIIDCNLRKLVSLIANVTSEDGYSFSTAVKTIDASGFKGNDEINFNFDRIVHSNEMKIDDFTVYANKGVNFENIFLPKAPVSICKGTNDIGGAKANVFNLATFKPLNTRFIPAQTIILRIDMHSPKPAQLVICAVTRLGADNEIRYYYSEDLVGGNIWQKILLKVEDFKSADGRVLKEWNDISFMYFESEVGILVNNFIWV